MMWTALALNSTFWNVLAILSLGHPVHIVRMLASDVKVHAWEIVLVDVTMSVFIIAKCEAGTVRLASRGSYFRNYGRVELCINQTWNSICDETWDHIDASVVCHQLGYSKYGQL